MFESFLKPPISFPTLTGSIVTFNSQYAGLPLKSHTVDIDSVSGVSSIVITNCKKNYLNPDTTDYGNYTINPDGTYNTATDRLCTGFIPCGAGVDVIAGTTLTAHTINTGFPFVGFAFYDNNKNYISRSLLNNQFTLTTTTPENTAYIRMFEQVTREDNITPSVYGTYRQWVYIESTDTTYIAFEGSTKVISIGQTVNEGEYNARTGVMEVTQPSVQTIQLPPCPIDVLEGVNNIWSDVGDTTLQYPKFG